MLHPGIDLGDAIEKVLIWPFLGFEKPRAEMLEG